MERFFVCLTSKNSIMKVCFSLILLSFALTSCKKEIVKSDEDITKGEVVSFKGNTSANDSLYTVAYLPTSTTGIFEKQRF